MQQAGPAHSQGGQGHAYPGEGPQLRFDLAHVVEEGGGDYLGRCLVGLQEAEGVPGHPDGVTLVRPGHPVPQLFLAVEERAQGPGLVLGRWTGGR